MDDSLNVFEHEYGPTLMTGDSGLSGMDEMLDNVLPKMPPFVNSSVGNGVGASLLLVTCLAAILPEDGFDCVVLCVELRLDEVERLRNADEPSIVVVGGTFKGGRTEGMATGQNCHTALS